MYVVLWFLCRFRGSLEVRGWAGTVLTRLRASGWPYGRVLLGREFSFMGSLMDFMGQGRAQPQWCQIRPHPRQDGQGPLLCGVEPYRTSPDHFELMNTFCVYSFEVGPQDSLCEERSLRRCIGAARTRRRRRGWSACTRDISSGLVTGGHIGGGGKGGQRHRGLLWGAVRSSGGQGGLPPRVFQGLCRALCAVTSGMI